MWCTYSSQACRTDLKSERSSRTRLAVLTFELHHVKEARAVAAEPLELIHGHGPLLLLPAKTEGELRWLVSLFVDLHSLRLRVIEAADFVLVLYHVCLILALCLMSLYGVAEGVGRRPFAGIRHLSLKDIITLSA